MRSKTIARIIAAHLEASGDRYDLSNSASIKVLALDLQEALGQHEAAELRWIRNLANRMAAADRQLSNLLDSMGVPK